MAKEDNVTATISTPYGDILARFYGGPERFVIFTTGAGGSSYNHEGAAPLKINRVEVELEVNLSPEPNPETRGRAAYKIGYYGRRRWGSWTRENLPDGVKHKLSNEVLPLLWSEAEKRDDLKRAADRVYHEMAMNEAMASASRLRRVASKLDGKAAEHEAALAQFSS